MKGKTTLPEWRWECDCRNCENIVEIHEGARNGNYCKRMVIAVDAGIKSDCIYADPETRVISCKYYNPKEK